MEGEKEESDNLNAKNSPCPHNLRIDSLCALCGEELPRVPELVAVTHSSDRLLQTKEIARQENLIKKKELDKQKKMILIVDLDQTILHTTLNNEKCDYTFSLGGTMFYVKFRPYLSSFLRRASKLFEMHVYTMGTREYAEAICRYLDPSKIYFEDRIVSRQENFNEHKKKIERITSISRNVVIIDDRADVWDYSKNLILVRPFWYFNRIDINNPHYLPNTKKEDSKTRIDNKVDNNSNKMDNNSNNVDNKNIEVGNNDDSSADSNNKVVSSTNSSNKVDGSTNSSNKTDSSINNTTNTISSEDKICIDAVNKNSCKNDSSDIKANAPIAYSLEEKITIPEGAIEPDSVNIVMDCQAKDESNPSKKLRSCKSNLIEEDSESNISELKNVKDKELKHIFKDLKRIHFLYFKYKKHARKFIKLDIFKNIKFLPAYGIEDLIKFAGGTICTKNPKYAIENRRSAIEYKIKNISVAWIFECIYYRRLIDCSAFVIDNFDDVDKYQKELEDEFFN